MILCKYLDGDGCLDIINNQRLKATDPITFNDPFEIYPGIIGKPDKDKTLRYINNDLLQRLSSATKKALPTFNGELALRDTNEFWRKLEQTLKPGLKEEIDKGLERASQTLRIICFCDPNKIEEGGDILLWSHYGDKHRGIRIFFETDAIKIFSTNLFPVVYSFERACIDITDPNSSVFNKNVEDAYRNTFKTKNKSWGYENEVRWIINLKECHQENGFSYIPLSPESIRRIDFGCKCKRDKALSILNNNVYRHVKLYKALAHEHKFCLNYEEINKETMDSRAVENFLD
jgi:hypothetical protein